MGFHGVEFSGNLYNITARRSSIFNLSTISMTMFNSYVKLPEGAWNPTKDEAGWKGVCRGCGFSGMGSFHPTECEQQISRTPRREGVAAALAVRGA